ncbi:MAG: hypothetical protein OIF57_19930 [Marinobacterium sp.]|nr:hypothetical protein [Marinobacterium sp.]
MGSLHLFIQHPNQIALELIPLDSNAAANLQPPALGLLCSSPTPYDRGQQLQLNFPDCDLHSPPITGTVLDCQPLTDSYQLALLFHTSDCAMRLRMVEQQLQIRLYQTHIAQTQGRQLSDNAAALEWIEHHAASFPAAFR